MTEAQSGETFVHVVIVNYNTEALVIDCLKSIDRERQSYPGLCVTVVDNASSDGSVAALQAAVADNDWQSWAKICPQSTNAGFAAGNNVVLEDFKNLPATHFWLLNPDTYLRPGALAGLFDIMASNPRAGIVGSRLEWPDGTQQHSTFVFPSVASEFLTALPLGLFAKFFERWIVAQPPTLVTQRYDWLSGASLLIRREVLEDVGLLDPKYFLYFEETDFCKRAAAHGWQCWFAPASRVVHLVGQSTGVTNPKQLVARRPRYWFESRRRYFATHHGAAYATAADVAISLNAIANRLVAAIRGSSPGIPSHFIRDVMAQGGCFRTVFKSKRDDTSRQQSVQS